MLKLQFVSMTLIFGALKLKKKKIKAALLENVQINQMVY